MGLLIIFIILFFLSLGIGIIDYFFIFLNKKAAILNFSIFIIDIIGIILISCVMFNINNLENYEKKYAVYHTLSQYTANIEDAREVEVVYDKIIEYNKDVYRAKNESFMTKGLHNKYYKDLPYITGKGVPDFQENIK